MKASQLISIVIKLLAVYVFLQFITTFPTALSTLLSVNHFVNNNSNDMGVGSLYSPIYCAFIIALAYLPLSLILYFNAERMSKRFVNTSDEVIAISGNVSNNVEAFAVRCFGLYALVIWGPALVQDLFRTIIYGTWQDDQMPFLQRFYQNWSILISPTIGVVLGLLLIFKAKGLIRLVQLSRPLSRERKEVDNE
jgi:hypothetical protein